MRPKASRSRPTGPTVEVYAAREASVGGSTVRRLLPHPRRRTVGAWCFVDHFGPAVVPAGEVAVDVGPHPHCGLATVTWFFEGQATHRDSLGSVQIIRPGQLNWMTAGRGISHAEEGSSHPHDTVVHGVQMWVALPESTRHGPARFEHYAELPMLVRDGLRAHLLVGELEDLTSPARGDSPLLGAEVHIDSGSHRLPVDPSFESAVMLIEGEVRIDGTSIRPGQLAYLGRGREHVRFEGAPDARLMWLGGEPLDEDLLMGWNFVVRTAEELQAASTSWNSDDGRFGTVHGARGSRIPAPTG